MALALLARRWAYLKVHHYLGRLPAGVRCDGAGLRSVHMPPTTDAANRGSSESPSEATRSDIETQVSPEPNLPSGACQKVGVPLRLSRAGPAGMDGGCGPWPAARLAAIGHGVHLLGRSGDLAARARSCRSRGRWSIAEEQRAG
jgi:hypothetical protein